MAGHGSNPGGTVSEGSFELGTDGPRRIVVGVDGTTSSLRAFAYAMGEARRHNADIVAVKVDSEVPTAARYGALASPASIAVPHDSDRDLRQWLHDQLTADAATWSARYTFVVRCGEPTEQLAKAAEEWQADMVVVGASTSLAHRLAGSLSQRLSRRRRWVLTIVP